MTTDAIREAAPATTRTLPTRSTWELWQLALFWIATNFHWAAVPLVILPSQVQVFLFTHHPANLTDGQVLDYVKNSAPGALASVVGPGLIVALLANPLFGTLSDRTMLRWGRRLPYILGGTLLNLVGLTIMATAANLTVLTLGLMLTQLANNAAAAPFHALLPDLVPAAQRGKASGFMGLGQMIGTILGATIPGLVLGLNVKAVLNGAESVAHYHQTILFSYGFTGGLILLMALLTIGTVRERPLAERQAVAVGGLNGGRLARDLGVTIVAIGLAIGATVGVLRLLGVDLQGEATQNVLILPAVLAGSIGVAIAFDFRPRQHGDFSWVLVTRAIMMMGIYTVLSFLQLYLQYVTFQHASNPPKAEDATALFIDITIVMAAISTPFAGILSDRFGRKRMVYLAGGFMALVGIIFLFAPFIVPQAAVTATYLSAAIFGLGYGAYVSVDWALVTDVLPDEAHFARDMGIWNVALTTPQVLSYVIGAFAIAALNPVADNLGYTALFILFAIYAILGTITVRYIRGVKR